MFVPQIDKTFRVFHVTLWDEASSCSCFTDCLDQINTWSLANPLHTPVSSHSSHRSRSHVFWSIAVQIVVQIEPRGFNYDSLFCSESSAAKAGFEILREEITSRFCGDASCLTAGSRVVLPETVRGSYSSMSAALAANGWPTVSSMQGKLVFNLNLFGSNNDCRSVHESLGAPEIFFDRAQGDSTTTTSRFSGFIESKYPTTTQVASNYIIRHRVIATNAETTAQIKVRHASYAANIFAYDYYNT